MERFGMLLLVSKALPQLKRFQSQKLGYFCGPRNTGNLREIVQAGLLYACDNDCFNGGLDADGFVKMIGKATEQRTGCLFVTAPDVVANAKATLKEFDTWELFIHAQGLPVAFVGQDGLTSEMTPWERFEAFFIGGSTEWKEGPQARELAQEAKDRGKWVHMGRVNKPPRVRYAHSIGVDSIDGTQHSWYPDTHIPVTLALLEELDDRKRQRVRKRSDAQLGLEIA